MSECARRSFRSLALQAYTQDYLNQSTQAGRRPLPLAVMRTLCPRGR